jgi:hypothetical protein
MSDRAVQHTNLVAAQRFLHTATVLAPKLLKSLALSLDILEYLDAVARTGSKCVDRRNFPRSQASGQRASRRVRQAASRISRRIMSYCHKPIHLPP